MVNADVASQQAKSTGTSEWMKQGRYNANQGVTTVG